jgi:enediyne biosynthesis protein E4
LRHFSSVPATWNAPNANKTYIIEVVGCGVAFIDCDNDGWMDLLVLTGARLEGASPDTPNRL